MKVIELIEMLSVCDMDAEVLMVDDLSVDWIAEVKGAGKVYLCDSVSGLEEG